MPLNGLPPGDCGPNLLSDPSTAKESTYTGLLAKSSKSATNRLNHPINVADHSHRLSLLTATSRVPPATWVRGFQKRVKLVRERLNG
ncbi:hypothetical protein CEXT_384951 [Caerostris extrusa]|uniref:Uncharacterized protein n=1 Tax=Caerostris extrusa TaxID=172846 RepID=A0AAV4M4W3_CAEEX|nr:hypothetical protein CEXT_384951 [Caerostris extrusa]